MVQYRSTDPVPYIAAALRGSTRASLRRQRLAFRVLLAVGVGCAVAVAALIAFPSLYRPLADHGFAGPLGAALLIYGMVAHLFLSPLISSLSRIKTLAQLHPADVEAALDKNDADAAGRAVREPRRAERRVESKDEKTRRLKMEQLEKAPIVS